MDLLQALATLMSFTAFGLVAAGVMKAFQIANDLGELKELLRDIRRGLEDHSPDGAKEAAVRKQDVLLRELDENGYAAAVLAKAQESAAPLVHAVNSESQLPLLQPEIVRSSSRKV